MKKIYLSILTTLIVLTILTTTTYAWITLATVNKIEGISLTATSGTYLEISLDGENYSTSLHKKDLITKLVNLKFRDVTSYDGKNFNSSYKDLEKAIPNNEYLSLEFHFRTTSRYTEIHLSDNIENPDYYNLPNDKTYISSKGITWRSKIDFLYGENDYIKKDEVRTFYAKDAMRVSFINTQDGTSKIFDLTGNQERGFGEEYGALTYYNHIKSENIIAPKAPNTIYELSELSKDDPHAITNSSHIITLEQSEDKDPSGRPYYKGKVVMNVWLEGWDADAFDAIFGDQLKMQFIFRAVMPKL